MKRVISAFLAVTALTLGAFNPETVETKPGEPYVVREGMPNVIAKLKAKQPVMIAYFGGSITAQNGWRPQTLKFFQKCYPGVEIKQVNAAIGGTGSNLGAFRLEYDVLRHKPDLVFVEFAVNDQGAKVVEIRRSMEGIVRQIWRALPEADICFVYTITGGNLKSYAAGTLPDPALVMEEIAGHYGIPTVNFGWEVARLEKEGKLVMKTDDEGMARVSGDELNEASELPLTKDGKIPFAKDGVHPLINTGHVLYTRQFAAAFPAIAAAGKVGAHVLPKPMLADSLENVRTVRLDDAGVTVTGGEKLPATDAVAKAFAHRLPGLWKLTPGATLEFKFKGTRAAAYDLLGSDCGSFEVTVDGEQSRENRRFDAYCTYRRLALANLFSGKDGIHTVRIRVTGNEFDKRAVLFPRNRADFDKDPAKYAPLNWYAGCLFIVGELVP